jgi:hypothetical protein
VTDPARGLLAKIERSIVDDTVTTTSLLNTCILLGGRLGSSMLRDWASRELKGYGPEDELPVYRKVVAGIYVDAFTGNGRVTGQPLGAEQLPDVAKQARIGHEVSLRQGLAQLEAMATAGKATHLILPGAATLCQILDAESPNPFQQATSLYWSVTPEVFRGVVEQVRSSVAEFVGELIASLPPGHAPTPEVADQAVSYAIGDIAERAHVTIVTAQAATGGTSSAGPTPGADRESWWARWRKRGLIIGGATVVAAVSGVGAWLGWNPFA